MKKIVLSILLSLFTMSLFAQIGPNSQSVGPFYTNPGSNLIQVKTAHGNDTLLRYHDFITGLNGKISNQIIIKEAGGLWTSYGRFDSLRVQGFVMANSVASASGLFTAFKENGMDTPGGAFTLAKAVGTTGKIGSSYSVGVGSETDNVLLYVLGNKSLEIWNNGFKHFSVSGNGDIGMSLPAYTSGTNLPVVYNTTNDRLETNPMPVIAAMADVTGQHGNTTLFTYAVPATGVYSIGGYLNITAVASAQINLSITYTAEDGTLVNFNLIPVDFTLGPSGSAVFNIHAKGGTNIIASTTGFSGTSMTYNAGETLQFLHN